MRNLEIDYVAVLTKKTDEVFNDPPTWNLYPITYHTVVGSILGKRESSIKN